MILLNVSAQQVNKATYSFYVSDETFGKDSELQLSINEMAENNPLYLYFSKERSVFTSYNLEQGRIPDSSDALAGTGSPNYYKLSSKQLLGTFKVKDISYTISRFIPEWEITSETKIISGYTCFKANGHINRVIDGKIKSKKIEAWFNPELAYSVGPNVFIGLPGLVVYAVSDYHCIYKLEKIEFNINNKIQEFNFDYEVIDEIKLSELILKSRE